MPVGYFYKVKAYVCNDILNKPNIFALKIIMNNCIKYKKTFIYRLFKLLK